MSCGRVIDVMGDRDLLDCLPSIGKPASTRQVQGIRPGSTSTIKPNDIESVSDCLSFNLAGLCLQKDTRSSSMHKECTRTSHRASVGPQRSGSILPSQEGCRSSRKARSTCIACRIASCPG